MLSVGEFDLADPIVQANPHPFYPLLRAGMPVLKSQLMGQPC